MPQCRNVQGCRESGGLGRLIYQTSLVLQNYADKVLRPHDLTLEQFHPMKVLNEAQQGMTQREICQAVQKTPANLTRILDRLESKELIQRGPNPGDRRAFLVKLTAKGMALVSEVACLFEKLSQGTVQGIAHKNQQITLDTLTKMMANIERMAADLEPPKP